MKEEAKVIEKVSPEFQEGVKMLNLLRELSDEDQRIAYAVMEGMKLQKAISNQIIAEI